MNSPNRSFLKFLADLILIPFTHFMVAIGAWSAEILLDDSKEIINEITEIPEKIDQYTGLYNIYQFLKKIVNLISNIPNSLSNLIGNLIKNLIVFHYIFCALILVGKFDWILDNPLSLISISIILTYLTYRE